MSGPSASERDQEVATDEDEQDPSAGDRLSAAERDEKAQAESTETETEDAEPSESEMEDAESMESEPSESESGAASETAEELEVEELSVERLQVEEDEERTVGPDDEDAAEVLYLDLEGLFLNLLGLEVDLSEVELDVSAVPGENRLVGNLLSSVAGLLDSGGLLGSLVPGLGSGEGDGILRSLLPTGLLGSAREKLSGLVPSGGDVTGAIRERVPSPRGALSGVGSGLIDRLPLEELIATALQTLVETVLQALEEQGEGASQEGQQAAADGGVSGAVGTNQLDERPAGGREAEETPNV